MKNYILSKGDKYFSKDEKIAIRELPSMAIPFWAFIDGVHLFVIDPSSTAILFSSVPQEKRLGPVGRSLLCDYNENGDSILTESGLKFFTKFLRSEKMFKCFCFNLRRYTKQPPSPLVRHIEIMVRMVEDLTYFVDIDPRKVSMRMTKRIYSHIRYQAIPALKSLDIKKVRIAFKHNQHMEKRKNRKIA